MNEEKMNVMRANMPLPDINDVDGKDSIIRYLPPINNLNAVISLKVLLVKKKKQQLINSVFSIQEFRSVSRNQHSSLEFVQSPTMRKKYKKRLEQMSSLNKNDTASFNMVDASKSTNINEKANNRLKFEIQNVKLHFLTERPAREYLAQKAIEFGDNNQSLDTTHSDEMAQLRIEDVKTEEPGGFTDSKMNALVPYDSSKCF